MMTKLQIPYIPDKLLFIYHTDTLDSNITRLMEVNHRSSEPVPRINFTTTYHENGGHLILPHKISMRSTKSLVHMRRMKYTPDLESNVSGYKLIKAGTMPEAVGEIFADHNYGVAALNILVPIYGTVGFSGYLHTKNHDISIRVPETSDLEVIACAHKGVFIDGEHVRNKSVLSFEEYFWKPTKKARNYHRELDTKKNAATELDAIRTRNRLYLLADKGKITVTTI